MLVKPFVQDDPNNLTVPRKTSNFLRGNYVLKEAMSRDILAF